MNILKNDFENRDSSQAVNPSSCLSFFPQRELLSMISALFSLLLCGPVFSLFSNLHMNKMNKKPGCKFMSPISFQKAICSSSFSKGEEAYSLYRMTASPRPSALLLSPSFLLQRDISGNPLQLTVINTNSDGRYSDLLQIEKGDRDCGKRQRASLRFFHICKTWCFDFMNSGLRGVRFNTRTRVTAR